jgi:hypothetical protein
MRRFAIGLICATVLLSLTSCDSSPQHITGDSAPPSQAPSRPPTGNLCERLHSKLTGDWKTEPSDVGVFAPQYDSCSLVDAVKAAHRIRVSLSVLPVTPAQSAAFRKIDGQQVDGWYVAKVIDGGVGSDSWAINPAAAAPWLIFHSAGRQIRLKEETDGVGSLSELRSIAQTIATLPGGLPTPPAVIERPECARGTAAAEHVLGTRAVVRRDAEVDGYLSCQWSSATRTVQVRSGGVGSDPYLEFSNMWCDAVPVTCHRVSVGDEAWQGDDGHLAFRSGQIFVDIESAPGAMDLAPVVLLARAIATLYRR